MSPYYLGWIAKHYQTCLNNLSPLAPSVRGVFWCLQTLKNVARPTWSYKCLSRFSFPSNRRPQEAETWIRGTETLKDLRWFYKWVIRRVSSWGMERRHAWKSSLQHKVCLTSSPPSSSRYNPTLLINANVTSNQGQLCQKSMTYCYNNCMQIEKKGPVDILTHCYCPLLVDIGQTPQVKILLKRKLYYYIGFI